VSAVPKIELPKVEERKPPHNLDFEQAFLGGAMRENDVFARLGRSVKGEHFFDPLHGRMFEAMIALSATGAPVTPLSLYAAMQTDPGVIETGGQAYFDALYSAASAIHRPDYFGQGIVDLALRRNMIRVAENVAENAHALPCDFPTADLIGDATAAFATIAAQKQALAGGGRQAVSATPFVWIDPAHIPRREWLFARHYVRKFVSATIGPGGMGKSALGVIEDLAMVTGRPLAGVAPERPLRVWSWNLEDPQEEHDRRYMAACIHHGITEADIGGRLFRDSGRDQPCVIAETDRSGSFVVWPVIDEIVAALLERKIDVLRIDPYVSCHSVPENDNGAQDRVIKAWGVVAERANCAIELIDHTRKMGDREITAEDSRGAGAKVAGCRSVRMLGRMSELEAGRAGVEDHLRYFRVSNGKPNLVPMSKQVDWFRLESVDLGNGPPADHVGVVVQWQWPDAFDEIAPGTLFRVQKAIAAGEWRKDPQAKQWAGKAVAEVLHLGDLDASVKARCRTLLHSWISGGALVVISKPDGSRKDKEFIEVGQWVEE
jgi:hypothetical protein